MKHIVITLLLAAALLTGCGANGNAPAETTPPAGNTQIANPWSNYDTLAEAEAAVGFALEIPETVGSYQADAFRVMSGKLLEIIYYSGDAKATVRKIEGEDQDISGVYNTYESVTESERGGGKVVEKTNGTEVLTLISADGYSWAIYASEGFPDGTDFLSAILAE